MNNNLLTNKKFRLRAVLMAALVLALFFAACGNWPDPATMNSTVNQSSSLPDQTSATTTSIQTQASAVTPVPSAQSSGTTEIFAPTAAQTTATRESEPEATPSTTTSIAMDPSPTPDIREGNGDSGILNEDFYWISLDENLKQRITGISYPADDSDIQIHYDDLRYIRLLHYDFEGDILEGELIVHATLADEVMEIFYQLFQAKYPLTSVILVDDFGQPADDTLSMEANNTSAFNYRFVTGTSTLSRHSFGAAIDINPMLNPYIVGDRIMPENGEPYADRSLDFPGKIDHDDLCYQLFTDRGWAWGGDWSGDKDYQHFSKKISP